VVRAGEFRLPRGPAAPALRGLDPLRPSDPARDVFDQGDGQSRSFIMDIYQQINELAAELRDAYLTKAERQAAIQQLHELQHDLELDEVEAVDYGDSERAALLYAEWQKIENVLAA
jgi:hypothetical protein